MKKIVIAGMAAATLMLSGCASWYPDTAADKPDDSPTLAALQAAKATADAKAAQESEFITEEPWLVAASVKEYVQYPMLNNKTVELAQYNQTLPDMVSRLSDVAGVNVFIASDLYVRKDGELAGDEADAGGQAIDLETMQQMDSTGPAAGQAQEVDTSNVMTLLGGSGAKAEGRFANPLETPISYSVNGSATELFDTIAAQLGISWKYDEARNRVTFYRLTRENFQVFFPGESETSISTGGGKGEDESVMSQESEFQLEGGDWDELASGIKALLTPYGKATIIKATGNIVVVDTPEAMEDIADYVEDINDIFGRQVYLQIRTATVVVENTNDFNITWNNILNTVNSGDFKLGLGSATVTTNALPNAINVIRSTTGASLALELLAQETESTEINEQSVTTLSNQPASLKVLTETGFISGISQQEDTNTIDNIVSDVQTDTVNTGFDATLVPRVVSESALQLQVALELSNNLELVNFDSTIVQTPTRDRNAVVQRAWLRNGETWVLAAFNSQKSSNLNSGSGSADFWGLGGGTSKSNHQQVLLVMITPHIQDGMF
ncbi:MAG: Type II secretory pathway component PulD-like protein [Marinobacter sp. T13-3]|nr:MAG: Type II secretory pathway component PulD-like protein [Marinobacter sp. T13-3]